MSTILIIFVFLIILILIWALFGGEKEAVEKRPPEQVDSQTPPPPEEMFRKRASDREIEEQFPEELQKRRRKTDREAPPEEEQGEDSEDGFKLPYLADDIIPDTSRLRVYKRTLTNSEIYAGKGDFNTAISLYDGVKSRTRDTEMRFKIDENIEYLKNYKSNKRRSEDKEKLKKKKEPSGEDQKELKFKLEGPQTIQIGVVDDQKVSTDKIVEKVSEEIRSELKQLQKKDIRDIKDSLKDLQDDNSRRMEDLEKLYRDQQRHEEKTEERDSDLSQAIRKEMEELSGLKDELNELSDKLNRSMETIPEMHSQPTVLEARYDQPIPVQIDPKPILEILEKLPGKKVEESKPEPAAKDEITKDESAKEVKAETSPGGQPSAEKASDETEASPATKGDAGEDIPPDDTSRFAEEKDITEHKKEEEEDEDFELLQDIIKGKDEDTLSDEEIFDRLLSQDQKRPMDKDIEILGEKKDSTDELDYLSRSADEQEVADADFYRNLLKSDRRKKRELPILKVSFDFKKLPDEMSLSREKNLLQHSFYRYKPMLEKAQQYIDKRQVRDAINYYKVVMAQNIPPEFKSMIRKNINDLTEYLEKYLTGD